VKPLSNVVAFKSNPRALEVKFGLIAVLPHRDLRPGDLVAFQWGKTLCLGVWYGPSGRDENGRFVTPGSPQETVELDMMKFTQDDLDSGTISIIGKVDREARHC
jgi:hypothetical protein